jgi:uncharacterized protein YndB with AHSA1/START domain
MTRFNLGCNHLTVLLLSLAASGHAQAVRNTSYVAPSGQRVLRQEGELEASVDTVWRILTTTEGLRSFLAPAVWIDFRPGGRWETAHNAGAQQGDSGNIVNEVLAYLPNEMFAVRVVQATSTFVHPEIAKQVWSVYQLQPAGDRRTKLTVSMVGWPSGPAADSVYQFFERGNAFTMRQLQQRITNGPRRW